jgi:hypothetical protein
MEESPSNITANIASSSESSDRIPVYIDDIFEYNLGQNMQKRFTYSVHYRLSIIQSHLVPSPTRIKP